MPPLRLLTRPFELDLRSLALLRVGLGALLLADLAIRGQDLRAHYTDAGVVPRATLVRHWPDPWAWSLHMLSGEAPFQALLFALAAAAAVALVLGYRTRTATAVSWVLLISLHHRNPLVLNAGDALLGALLLWSIFLPLGAAASLDARGAPPPTAWRLVSVGSAAVVIQVALLYLLTGAVKLNELWATGDAMLRVLSSGFYGRQPVAGWLLNYPDAMRALARAVPWIELAAAALLFVPVGARWVRLVLVPTMIAFHLGVELTMHVGLFSYASCVAWLALLPSAFWDRWGRDPSPAAAEATLTPSPRGPVLQGVALALLAYVALFNLDVLSDRFGRPRLMPEPLRRLERLAWLGQRWTMFGRPGEHHGWYIIVGDRRDGSRVELLTGDPFDPLTVARPDDPAGLYGNHRWRKLYRNLSRRDGEAYRGDLPRALCDAWNRRADAAEQITHLEVNYIEEPPSGERRRLVFYRGVCPSPDDVVLPPPAFDEL